MTTPASNGPAAASSGGHERVAWIDGDLVPLAEGSVPITDHGLIVGDGAFETLRIVRGLPFAIERHLRRLDRTLAALAILPPPRADLRAAMIAVAEANGLESGRLRLTVTGGDGPFGSGEPVGPARVVIVAEPLGVDPVPSAVTVPWTRNEAGALAGLKTTSYAENVRALRYAHGLGASEAIFPNTRGELCEGTGTNVFVVVDGQVLTPPLSSGCLAGVTRELVLEVAEVREQTLDFDVLATADEVFLTSSTRDVQALAQVDDRMLVPGPVTAEVAAAFAALVADTLDP